MADRIHTRHSGSTTDPENPNPNVNRGTFFVKQEIPVSDTRPMLEKSRPPIYESNNLRKPRCCAGGCCCCFSFIVTLIILIGIAVLVFYLVVKPKTPSYSVNNISIKGFNLNQLTSQTFSPEFDVSISANNPNTKIGIYYEPSSSVEIYTSSNVELSIGTLPVFYQPTQNVTVFNVIMKGTVPLTTALTSTLLQQQSAGKIPLVLYSDVPVKLKIMTVTSWKITVKETCNIVNKKSLSAILVQCPRNPNHLDTKATKLAKLAVAVVAVAAAAAAAAVPSSSPLSSSWALLFLIIFYLIIKLKAPIYSVNNTSIKGFNLNQMTSPQTLSPEFDVSISANNPNTKIRIYYEPSSSVSIYTSSNVELSNGILPVFYQPTQIVTVFDVIMKGTVPLMMALSSTLPVEQSTGRIPLTLYSDVPAKLKIGSLTT
ncbi:hypothetical protein NE237_008333 [Protea cynaroides]|uniref:Late embryogenesis abundant protein LEA-2 subgroup domain-containing protein n=1 Tax=Protea cynaroides TaxID=273540 RepID=A0A9Q0KVG8_9MAGN|nr:hypothetical protein NE237_008333 [Protea cynaroides]